MSWIDTPILRELSEYLDLAAYRQTLISSNLANIDTPGYRSKALSFENALRQSLEDQVLQMVRTNSEHMAPDEPAQEIRSPEVVETGQVDLDAQMVALTKNSIEYQHMVGILNKKFTMLKTAITEGGL